MDSTPPRPGRLHKPSPDPAIARSLASVQLVPGERHAVAADRLSYPRLQTHAIALDHGSALTTPLSAGGLAPPPPRNSSMLVQHPPRTSSIDWTSETLPSPRIPGSPNRRSLERPLTPTTPTKNYYSSPQIPPIMTPPPTVEREPKRRSWFSRSPQRVTQEERGPTAWIAGHQGKIPYMTFGLATGQPVQDIWDPTGDCLVYLFPQSYDRGPSFRVESSIFQSSSILTRKVYGDVHSETSVSDADARSLEGRTACLSMNPQPVDERGRRVFSGSSTNSYTSQGTRSTSGGYSAGGLEFHLFLDIELDGKPAPPATRKSVENLPSDDEQKLIDVRNLFAFLTGQALVATERRPTFFSIFMKISDMLKTYEFSNLDSSTFGQVATSSFDSYIEELGLADVRGNRQKTVEGIVLAERMRSVPLYNEAFTHCVGEHNDIERLNGQLFRLISPITINRLGRAALDLDKRTASVGQMLEDFDFPSIFSGMFNSKTVEERKLVDFDTWKDSFFATRKFVLGYYKSRFGSWPPKANKNTDFEIGGLNRLVLRELYHDLSAMYDLLVDRNSLTNRTADGVLIDQRDADAPMVRALRHILSEYDRSSPPVKPPMPFDLPTMPTLKSTRPDFETGNAKADMKASNKKLKDDEIYQILRASYNADTRPPLFVDAFRDFEAKAAHGCTLQELRDQRVGQWIFMYAVLQALPLLVVDAPALRFHKGVEYFLCEPPRGGVPWARDDVKRNWYGVAASGGMVSLPSDLLTHSIDGVFRRSHCWEMAERWSRADPALNRAMHLQDRHEGNATVQNTPLAMPGVRVDSRAPSLNRADKRLSSLHPGLEAIRMPDGGHPQLPSWPISPAESRQSSRPVTPRHEVDASKTFDAILASADLGRGRKKK